MGRDRDWAGWHSDQREREAGEEVTVCSWGPALEGAGQYSVITGRHGDEAQPVWAGPFLAHD